MFSSKGDGAGLFSGLTQRLVAASILLALVVGGGFTVMLLAIDELRADDRRTRRAQGVTVAADQLERLLLDLETGERGFILTRQEQFLAPWAAARAGFARRARDLLALTAGDGETAERARRIVDAQRAYIDRFSVPAVQAARRGDPSAGGAARAADGKRRVDALRAQYDELLGPEQRRSASATASSEAASLRASAGAIVGLGGSLVLIVLYVAYLRRTIVLPVRRAASMAGRVAAGDLGARLPEREAGEIGALELAFNVMGGSLERNRDELAALAEEQAALRRVATLVARGAPPDEVFAAVAEEAGRLTGADLTILSRYESAAESTNIAAWSRTGRRLPLGSRSALGGHETRTLVRETGRTVRIDRYEPDTDLIPPAWRGLRSGVGAPINVEGRLWGAMTVASEREEPLPAGTEDRLAAFTDLVATAVANAESRSELMASRVRIVATADETRRRIERDLHDGAQQRLVSLALQLRAAQTTVPAELPELDAELDGVATGLAHVLEELRETARGIHPAILSEGGLGPALRTLARRSAVLVRLDLRVERRLPEPIEVGAYYVVSEALTNTAKHAGASAVDVRIEVVEGRLRMWVRDDGVGGAEFGRGSGLVGLKDRVEALGGSISVTSAPRAGTALVVELPLGDDVSAPPGT